MKRQGEIEVTWWFRLGGAILILAALVSFFSGFFRTKFYRLTGDAVWIWPQHRLASGDPVVFFAAKDFDVPMNPPFIRIKVAVDPEYMLYFNGVPIGGGVAGRDVTLDSYDVTDQAKKGASNRIVIAVRSSNGVGGLLAAVDFAPLRENDIVTDPSWMLYTRWKDEILVRNPADIPAVPIRVIGTPPTGRWDFFAVSHRKLDPPDRQVVAATGSESVSVPVRRVEIVGGIAVASASRESATAYQFDRITGGARIEVPGEDQFDAPRVVRIRYAYDRGDLNREGDVRTLVVAPGERAVTDPSSHLLKYIAVLDRSGRASVVKDDTQEEKRDEKDDD